MATKFATECFEWTGRHRSLIFVKWKTPRILLNQMPCVYLSLWYRIVTRFCKRFVLIYKFCFVNRTTISCDFPNSSEGILKGNVCLAKHVLKMFKHCGVKLILIGIECEMRMNKLSFFGAHTKLNVSFFLTIMMMVININHR